MANEITTTNPMDATNLLVNFKSLNNLSSFVLICSFHQLSAIPLDFQPIQTSIGEYEQLII